MTQEQTYRIRPEFWEQWGSVVDENTRVTDEEIRELAHTWDVSVESLMEQVEIVEADRA